MQFQIARLGSDWVYSAQILMLWKHLFPSRNHHCNQFLFMRLN